MLFSRTWLFFASKPKKKLLVLLLLKTRIFKSIIKFRLIQGVYFKSGAFSAHTGNLKYIFELIYEVLRRWAIY